MSIWAVALSACQGTGPSPMPMTSRAAFPTEVANFSACPTPGQDQLALLSAQSVIADDSGKTLVLHQTYRFSVYLDDRTYPLNELHQDPAGTLGVISNGSIRGPNCYPIMFEAVTQGRVTLSDRNFLLHIVVDNNAPASQFPLH